MSPRSAAATSSGAGRGAFTAVIVLAVAVGMLLLVRSKPGLHAFDPRSDAADGASAAVQLLEAVGATVTISSEIPAVADGGRVFVIADRLSAEQRAELLGFVDAGGVAVVADPLSPLHAGRRDGAVEISDDPPPDDAPRRPAEEEANVSTGTCTIAALEDLRGVFTPDGLLFPTRGEQDRCLGDDDHSFVIEREHGAGVVVGFGDNRIVTNRFIRFADNAGLIAALLVPAEGAAVRVVIGTSARPAPSDVGTGDETLADIVRPGVWMGLAQLALAFVVFCVARGVRPGRAVREPLPTTIAGNELVVATGNLMQRAQHAQRAGLLIREDFYRRLCQHFRVPAGAGVDEILRLAGPSIGVTQEELVGVVYREVADPAGLIALRADIDALGRRLMNDPSERIQQLS
jgi:hypothetical protein